MTATKRGWKVAFFCWRWCFRGYWPAGRDVELSTKERGALTARLEAQFAFLNEADRLKSVLRATTLVDGSRPENSGEHSCRQMDALRMEPQGRAALDRKR